MERFWNDLDRFWNVLEHLWNVFPESFHPMEQFGTFLERLFFEKKKPIISAFPGGRVVKRNAGGIQKTAFCDVAARVEELLHRKTRFALRKGNVRIPERTHNDRF